WKDPAPTEEPAHPLRAEPEDKKTADHCGRHEQFAQRPRPASNERRAGKDQRENDDRQADAFHAAWHAQLPGLILVAGIIALHRSRACSWWPGSSFCTADVVIFQHHWLIGLARSLFGHRASSNDKSCTWSRLLNHGSAFTWIEPEPPSSNAIVIQPDFISCR